MNLWTNKQQLPFEGSWGCFGDYQVTMAPLGGAQVYTHKYTDVLCMYISIKVWHDTLRLQQVVVGISEDIISAYINRLLRDVICIPPGFFRTLSVDSSSPACAHVGVFAQKNYQSQWPSDDPFGSQTSNVEVLATETQFMSKHVVMGALCYDCWMVPVEIWWRSRNVQLFSRLYKSQLV